MKETSYLTDPCNVTGSAAIATTFGKNLFGDHRRQAPDEFASIIYNDRNGGHDGHPCGETNHAAGELNAEPSNIMGDKSPKSNQKKSSQKQAIASSADQKKKAAAAAKSVAAKKR